MRLGRFKLTILAPLVLGIVLALVFALVLAADKHANNNMINRSIETSGQTIISSSTSTLFNYLYKLDVVNPQIMVERFVSAPDIERAVVRDSTGRTISEATAEGFPEEDNHSDLAQSTRSLGWLRVKETMPWSKR